MGDEFCESVYSNIGSIFGSLGNDIHQGQGSQNGGFQNLILAFFLLIVIVVTLLSANARQKEEQARKPNQIDINRVREE